MHVTIDGITGNPRWEAPCVNAPPTPPSPRSSRPAISPAPLTVAAASRCKTILPRREFNTLGCSFGSRLTGPFTQRSMHVRFLVLRVHSGQSYRQTMSSCWWVVQASLANDQRTRQSKYASTECKTGIKCGGCRDQTEGCRALFWGQLNTMPPRHPPEPVLPADPPGCAQRDSSLQPECKQGSFSGPHAV